jgi:uncharacterized protein YbaR (Trm112 family)
LYLSLLSCEVSLKAILEKAGYTIDHLINRSHNLSGLTEDLCNLGKKWRQDLGHTPVMVFDREGYVRYYGFYSNKSRGMRKKACLDDTIPAVMPNEMSSKESRQNWARLIQKIYEVDPLVCPKCHGSMKIIAFIEEVDIIEKILRHLGLWDVRNHDPPQKVSDYILELVCDEADSRIPELENWY